MLKTHLVMKTKRKWLNLKWLYIVFVFDIDTTNSIKVDGNLQLLCVMQLLNKSIVDFSSKYKDWKR